MPVPADCLPSGPAFAGYCGMTFAIGCLTGLAEILPRYRDEPLKAAGSRAGFFYWAFNGVISYLAFLIVFAFFADRFGLIEAGKFNHVALLKVSALTGFGAMALARSKLFQVSLPNGQQVSAGPAHVLDVLFNMTDGYIAKYRMTKRVALVEKHFKDVDFEKLRHRMLTLAQRAHQSVSVADQVELGRVMALIAAEQMPSNEKSLRAGYVLLDHVGERFLAEYSYDDLKRASQAAPQNTSPEVELHIQ